LLDGDLPGIERVLQEMNQPAGPSAVAFDTADLGSWDTGLLVTLVGVLRAARANGVTVQQAGLPEGAQRLLALAFAVKEREGARRETLRASLFRRVGLATADALSGGRELLTFTGEVLLSATRFVTGKATYLRSDIALHIQEAGAEALPITTLITYLIGMIFAFVGVMQLQQFGAGIYTADLVAIAMVREMSPIMTAILMAGRTGASYAAQIGTMKVNEEIDALTTLGLNSIDFLVTPRVIALLIMLPLLSLYGSAMGILGGMGVGLVMLDVGLMQYVQQTVEAVEPNDLWGGLFKSVVFGGLVAMAGCQQGMACGDSALAVGQSTTRAVVTSIVLIVISASVLTIIYINLDI
jgi:phospholipid/cholesterol/gamma-HCH transport system permease protein